MKVTIHHCFFDGTRQRHPRVRFAKVHLYNNYSRNWGIYAVCASVESQVIICSLNEIVIRMNFKTVFNISPKSSYHIIICLYQIFSQHNIYEAGQKKVAFKYLHEKVCLPLMFSGQVMFYLLGCIGILYVMNNITKELEKWLGEKLTHELFFLTEKTHS